MSVYWWRWPHNYIGWFGWSLYLAVAVVGHQRMHGILLSFNNCAAAAPSIWYLFGKRFLFWHVKSFFLYFWSDVNVVAGAVCCSGAARPAAHPIRICGVIRGESQRAYVHAMTCPYALYGCVRQQRQRWRRRYTYIRAPSPATKQKNTANIYYLSRQQHCTLVSYHQNARHRPLCCVLRSPQQELERQKQKKSTGNHAVLDIHSCWFATKLHVVAACVSERLRVYIGERTRTIPGHSRYPPARTAYIALCEGETNSEN